MISNSKDIKIFAEINDVIIGYGELVTSKNLITRCYVSSMFSRNGVGRKIIHELEHIACKEKLNYLCIESSENEVKFYFRCGYTVIRRGSHVMNSGTSMNCVIMRKEL